MRMVSTGFKQSPMPFMHCFNVIHSLDSLQSLSPLHDLKKEYGRNRRRETAHRTWMDGWIDGWMDEWMNAWMDGKMDDCVHGWRERDR